MFAVVCFASVCWDVLVVWCCFCGFWLAWFLGLVDCCVGLIL